MPTTLDRKVPEVPGWVLTDLLAAGQSIAVALIIAIGSGDGGRHAPGAYLFAAGFGLLLLARRFTPTGVLVVSILAVFVYYAIGYPPIGMAVPVVGAFYSAAERGRVVTTLSAGAILLAVSLYFRIDDGEASHVLAYDVVTNAALIGCAVALATAVRHRRSLDEQHARVLLLERRHHEERADRQIQTERVQLARDVHDSIGHALSLVSVQARVAQQALGEDDVAVARALDNVVSATQSSLADLRRTISMLQREDGAAERSPLNLAGIEQIAQAARDVGLDVRVHLGLDDAPIPAITASTAFRIVQESLTNVLRHAEARRVDVDVRTDGTRLVLEIADDGRGCASDRLIPGRGIVGMRERAALLGGTVTTVNTPSGFLVRALLPREARA